MVLSGLGTRTASHTEEGTGKKKIDTNTKTKRLSRCKEKATHWAHQRGKKKIGRRPMVAKLSIPAASQRLRTSSCEVVAHKKILISLRRRDEQDPKDKKEEQERSPRNGMNQLAPSETTKLFLLSFFCLLPNLSTAPVGSFLISSRTPAGTQPACMHP